MAYTNLVPLSIDTDGSIYNGGLGYKEGYRVNSSGVETAQSGMCVIGYIPVVIGQTIRLKNVTISGTKTPYFATYYQDKSFQQVVDVNTILTDDGNGVYTGTSPITGWVRITCGVIDDTSILTIDEEITDETGSRVSYEINRIKKNLIDSYAELATSGVALPAEQSSDNLPEYIKAVMAAMAQPWNEELLNIAVAPRSVWGISSNKPTLISSNAECAIGVTTSNSYAYTDRESKAIYLMPVNAKACDVTVTNADGSSNTFSFIGLKANGDGTFTTVFNSGKISANTYEWMAGNIDYITISLEHTDGSSYAWGYNDSNISVKFSNGIEGEASGGGSFVLGTAKLGG